MTPQLYIALLFVLTFLMFALPLVPALREWYARSDAEPLRVVRREDANIRHFATSFKTQVGAFLVEHGIDPRRPPAPFETRWQYDEPIAFLGRSARPQFQPDELRRRLVGRVLIGCGDLQLPTDMVFEQEVYCCGSVRTGDRTAFRALYAERDVELGEECVVVRWLHADGSVRVAARGHLLGRLSAAGRLHVAAGCEFERMSAPIMRFSLDNLGVIEAADRIACSPWTPPSRIEALDAETLKARADLTVPARTAVDKHLIATRAMRIGARVAVRGSLKAHRSLHLGEGSIVRGAIVSRGPIEIGDGCLIKGPVISETSITIGVGCVIGASALPTTVVAPRIVIAPGVQISGTVWAGVAGRVAPTSD